MTMSDLIMEDVKHQFVWNTIINILNDIRENYNLRFQLNDKYCYHISYPEATEEKRIYISKKDTISTLENSLVINILRDYDICLASYMCDYKWIKCNNNSDLANMNCIGCPAKIMTSQKSVCLNGYRTMVAHIKLENIPYLEEDVFNTIIRYCKQIRDIEYKNDVLLRSQIK